MFSELLLLSVYQFPLNSQEEGTETKKMFVLRFYGPVNSMESCQARPVYLTTLLLGRLSPQRG